MVAILKQGATKEYIQNLLDKIYKEVRTNGVDTKKYCGKINLKMDALDIQKGMRDEWR
ncbi:MAG: hypothetical protein COA33_009465 [Fluviicola sp.]|nr:hypothetical protein [Fluviicola sp.]